MQNSAIHTTETIEAKENIENSMVNTSTSSELRHWIKDLGFPIVMTIFLLYNSWSVQTFLVAFIEKKELQNEVQNDKFLLKLDEQNRVLRDGFAQMIARIEQLERNKR